MRATRDQAAWGRDAGRPLRETIGSGTWHEVAGRSSIRTATVIKPATAEPTLETMDAKEDTTGVYQAKILSLLPQLPLGFNI